MLPTTAHQLDYQDFGLLVWNDIEKIENFYNKQGQNIDLIVSKLRNGTIVGSILANYFGINLGVIYAPRETESTKYEIFIPKHQLNKNINILLVDSICGTGESLQNLKDYLISKCPKSNINTYVTLVDKKAKIKPDIIGNFEDRYIQPPWEWLSFTPHSHLERLEAGYTKATKEKNSFIGFSSNYCKMSLEEELGKKISIDSKTFHNFAYNLQLTQSTSNISALNKPDNNTLYEYKTKFKKSIQEKVDFILNNGITHYIEENQTEAILIAQKSPVTHIFYFDGNNLHKIYSKEVSLNSVLNLN